MNYEDPDINVAIPVFSIHGNHDDPSGEGHLAPLDILQMSGLINYYGRTPESDNIQVKPVLLQKGTTKLALYGMSNVRDERLFRTFRDGNVRFFQPNTHRDEWFNLGSVHQNHHAYTESGYLPENFLPEFLDLVIWGHEHECKIDPITNVEMGFKVIQPGSSVATSLVDGESVTKSVTILSITGKECEYEPIRLKTVRPFVQRDIALQDDRKLRELALSGGDNKPAVNRHCVKIIDEMIEEANQMWLDQQEVDHDQDEEIQIPKPLIRLRVEYTAPEGGNFNVDNPQRFSARFIDQVANTTDVIQYHRKKTTTRRTKETIEVPDAATLAQMAMDSIKMESLVKEFLSAQSLTVFPQNAFGDAVTQFVDKDDKHAMEEFVADTVQNQVAHLVGNNAEDDVDYDVIAEMMEGFKAQMEKRFEKGDRAAKKRSDRRPKPDSWDSDEDGHWEDDPASIVRGNDGEEEEEEEGDDAQSTTSRATSTRGRGRGRGRAGRAAGAGTTRKSATTAAAKKAAPTKAKTTTARGKKKAATPPSDEEEEEDEDVIMLDDNDDDDDEGGLFMTQESASATSRKTPARTTKTPARSTKTPAARSTKAAASQGTGRQTQLSFASQSQVGARSNGKARRQEPSEDEISDDDAFEPPPAASRRR